MSPFTGLIKNSCLNNPNFLLDLSFFKLVEKKNFLSISELISEIVIFLEQNEKFSVNFPKNASKQHKSIVKLYVAQFEVKNSFC